MPRRHLQIFCISVILFHAALLTGCMKWVDGESEEFELPAEGLFIVNEGNFQYGNATLSFYNPESGSVTNELFYRANGMRLGDVGQSMSIYDNRGWIVVNNSHVIFAIDLMTCRERGRIENLTSPRYICFINDEKAYVSQLWDNRIFIVNPRNYSITGYIEIPEMSRESGSTEQMVCDGRYVYCSCWSYQNRIIKIDSETDRVIDAVSIGVQPRSLVMDRYGKLWTVTDGGSEGNPVGNEVAALHRIDAMTLKTERRFLFRKGENPSSLQLNSEGDTLYWLNDDVWRMDVNETFLPDEPFIDSRNTKYYGLTISPETGDVYVADAIDYQQPGMIYRYSSCGEMIDKFYCGVTPGAFCWK